MQTQKSKPALFRKARRSGIKGISFTIQIWDARQGKYSLCKTFSSWKYGVGKTGERAAERDADTWAVETYRQLEAGIITGNFHSESIHTTDAITKYIQYLTSRNGNEVHILNVTKRLEDLPTFMPALDMKGAGKHAYEWWYAWCSTPCIRTGKPRSNTTRNNCLGNLKSFVNWCWQYKEITGLPSALDLRWIKKLPQEKTIKAQFTIEEIRLALQAIDHPFIIRFALYAYLGLRAREALHLQWNDFIEGHVIIRKAKGGKQRVVMMQDGLMPYLDRHKAHHDYKGYLFPESLRISNMLVKEFDEFLHEVSLPKNGRSTHSLRHCYAGMMTASGEPTALVQSYMGHSDSDMTMHYAQMAAFYRADVEGWERGKLELLYKM